MIQPIVFLWRFGFSKTSLSMWGNYHLEGKKIIQMALNISGWGYSNVLDLTLWVYVNQMVWLDVRQQSKIS